MTGTERTGATGPVSYGRRLAVAVGEFGPLCVGIDPHPSLLQSWGLSVDPAGLERCARTMVEAAAGRAAQVKPQSAFYEAFGSAGIAVLERVLADCREAGLLSLLDVKRGDIGSTMDAYTAAYLTDSSPLAADAITLSPYLGVGSLTGAIEQAWSSGRGVYLLAATSNPEAGPFQRSVLPTGPVAGAEGSAATGPVTVAQAVVEAVVEANAAELSPSTGSGRGDVGGGSGRGDVDGGSGRGDVRGGSGRGDVDGGSGRGDVGGGSGRGDGRTEAWGSVGLVIGATIDAAMTSALDLGRVNGPILAPGVGAQGGGAEDLDRVFGRARRFVLPSSSRAVMAAGPDAAAIRAAIDRAQRSLD